MRAKPAGEVRDGCTRRTGGNRGRVALLCVMLVMGVMTPLFAVPVFWATDADGFWHVASNWSSDPALPGASDDVTLDRPGFALTITHSQGTTSIRSLLANEALNLTGGSLTVAAPSQANAALSVGRGVSLTATGAGTTFTAGGSTTIDGSNLYALAGAALDLSLASSYVHGGTGAWSDAWLRASGASSLLDLSGLTSLAGSTGTFSELYVEARSGGRLDLSALPTYTTGAAQMLADGAGSVLDLSSMTSLIPGPIFGCTSSLVARNGGTVLAPNLTTLNGVNLTLDGTGTLATSQIATYRNGVAGISGVSPDFSSLTTLTGSRFNVNAVPLDFHHITDLSYVTIDVRGGATADLSGATKVDGASFIVAGGVTLAVPQATSYVNSSTAAWSDAYLKADGAGSRLDLSTLTALAGSMGSFSELYIQALSGGSVDLSHVPTYTTGAAQVLADGASSVVDLSGLASFTPGPIFGCTSSITPRNGGTVLAPNLTTLHGVDLNLNGTGTMATSQITTYTNGIATVSGVAPDFSGMANIDGASFIVSGGLTLAVPNATGYINRSTSAWSDSWFRATGAGTVLDLSTLTTLGASTAAFSQMFVQAYSGGLVDLRNVPSFTRGSGVLLADGANSLIDLSSMTLFSPTNTAGRSSSIEARNGGRIVFSPGTLTVGHATMTATPTGTITAGTVRLGTGATLVGSGTLDAGLINGGVTSPGVSPGTLTIGGDYTQELVGRLVVELGGVAEGQFDVLNVLGTAYLGGTLEVDLIPPFVPALGDSFTIMTFESRVGRFSTYLGTDLGDDVVLWPVFTPTTLTLTATLIPEPATLSLLALGGLGLLARRRRRA